MTRSRRKQKHRILGPGVVEPPAADGDDLTLTLEGLRRAGGAAGGDELDVRRPVLDRDLPREHPGGEHIVTQVVVERGRTAVVDIVVPITRQLVSWHCYARSARGNKWLGVGPGETNRGLAVSVGRSRLVVRGAGPAPGKSETAEIAWRWKLDNIATGGRGSDLIARVVVKLSA